MPPGWRPISYTVDSVGEAATPLRLGITSDTATHRLAATLRDVSKDAVAAAWGLRPSRRQSGSDGWDRHRRPAQATRLGDELNVAVPLGWGHLGRATRNHRGARWDDDRGVGVPGGDGLVTRAADLVEQRPNLGGVAVVDGRQRGGDDGVGGRVDSQMEFSPGPAPAHAMLVAAPLAGPVPGAVNHQIARLTARRHSRRCAPSGDRLLAAPQRQAATAPQTGLIGCPVRHLERHLRDVMASGVVGFVRHAGRRPVREKERKPLYRTVPPPANPVIASLRQPHQVQRARAERSWLRHLSQLKPL